MLPKITAPDKCEWEDDDDGAWWTSCGHGWCFTDSGPTGNGMNYCPFCGKLLVEVPNAELRGRPLADGPA